MMSGARKESRVNLIRSILITLMRGLHGRFGLLPEREPRNFSSAPLEGYDEPEILPSQ
jgi:hypothetical protein